jgi:hypothetical protein
MSAPTTHDPRFVNTKDGVCWERRAVTDSGLGLYAVEGSCKCPPFKMATLAELAEHGIAGSADVLPVPVGPGPQPLPAAAEGPALPWAASMDDGDLSLFLGDLVSAAVGRWRSGPEVPDRVVLADIEKVCADWRTPGVGLRGDAPEEPAPDAVTQSFVPVAALREALSREEPHDSPLHREHRTPHDLDLPESCRLDADQVDEVSRSVWFGGGAS